MSFNLARWAIARWQFMSVMIGLLIALGLAAFASIPRTEDPQLDGPTFGITAILPGASPREIEQQVTKPIEDALYKLDQLDKVRSTSIDGVSFTNVAFTWGVSPRASYDDVVREVNALRPALPAGLTKLEVQRQRSTRVAIVQVALTSDTMPMLRFTKLAEKLREKIAAIKGIHEANIWGVAPTEAQVALDLNRLAALNLPANAVVNAVRAGGGELPIGNVVLGARRFNVHYAGAYPDLKAIADIPVTTQNGAVLHVGDVANVHWSDGEPSYLTRFNGKRAILVSANQNLNQDVTKLSKAIAAELDTFERTLPAGVKLVRGFDQAKNVTKRLDQLARDFMIALALVSITLLPIGLRAAGVVMIAIPLSLLIGVLVLYYSGFTLNQLSIAGFVLSLGILVDDAIVVTENIARWLREGEPPAQAAIKATNQIALAVAGCTACLVLAFVPLLALPESSGEFIRSMPVTVFATISGSFIVAMTVIPLAARYVLRADHNPEGNRLLVLVNAGIHRLYAPLLRRALRRPGRVMLGLLALSSLAIPVMVLIGSSLFPPAESTQFLVRVRGPQGASLVTTDAMVRRVEAELARHPEVRWYAANSGHSNPPLYYNVNVQDSDPSYGEVAVSLKEWVPLKSAALLDRLRHIFSGYAGAEISVIEFAQGPNSEAPVAFRISGPDLDVLSALAHKIEGVMITTPGLRDVGNPLRRVHSDLRLVADEAATAAKGVAAGSLRQTLQMALSGVNAATLRDRDGDNYPVMLRLPLEGSNTRAQLDHIQVPTTSGSAVPLSAIAQPVIESGPAAINRYKRERQITITAEVTHGTLISRATQAALDRVKAQVPVPAGYSLLVAGEAETQSASFAGLVPAIAIASLGILAVLVLEFGKFRTVIVVAGIIPFGFLGAVLALMIAGYSLSFTASIGLIALVGLEIKNSILLVDFTEQLRGQGMAIRDAVEKAGELRFLPVLLTSVTAIGGLLPLALENNGLYSPMAVAMIGGLITSTLLARIATPVMYLLFANSDAPPPEAVSAEAMA